MIKYALAAVVLSVLFTTILVSIFKTMGAYIAIGAAAMTGLILVYWFARSESREPTKNERVKLISIYGIVIVAIMGVMVMSFKEISAAGIIPITILTLAYPAFLSIIFTPKSVAHYIKQPNTAINPDGS